MIKIEIVKCICAECKHIRCVSKKDVIQLYCGCGLRVDISKKTENDNEEDYLIKIETDITYCDFKNMELK